MTMLSQSPNIWVWGFLIVTVQYHKEMVCLMLVIRGKRGQRDVLGASLPMIKK
ncbi:hypothetical protein BVRB_3g070700 [Beta vulgaris subsp. vulgaris]|uniref:Uncharacterized protein n=1 Tax=Beta vulgaris subsp. vulgaris TaxID=3555 RepID=A0A0J8BCI2_BETVV|nr:hypothetical protein BVRB_3g070700 [Beta vulgaris subsp. vulgaris]